MECITIKDVARVCGVVFGLKGHVQGVILQPGLVGQRKGIIIIRILTQRRKR